MLDVNQRRLPRGRLPLRPVRRQIRRTWVARRRSTNAETNDLGRDPIFDNPEVVSAVAQRAFHRAKREAIAENDRLGIPSYGSENGKIVVRQPPEPDHTGG